MEYQQISDITLQYITIICSLNSLQRLKTNEVKRQKSYFLHLVESDSLNK